MRLFLFVVMVTCWCLLDSGVDGTLRYCRKRAFHIDVIIAYGIAPVRNAFPHNLFRNGRTPSTVTEFTKVLLTIFDYQPTRVGMVSFNQELRTITGFTNKRHRLWEAFQRWEPTRGTPVAATAIQEIRQLFAKYGKRNSRRILILVTDRISAQQEDVKFQADYARSEGIDILTVGYDETYRNLRQIRGIAGHTGNTFTVSNPYFLPRIVRKIKDKICRILGVTFPIKPPPPPTTPRPAPVAPTTVSPILDEIVVLADDSESTRDFSGLSYFYNNDSVHFLDSVVTNVDYGQCRLAIYLFSGDTRGLQGNLTTDQSMLQNALNDLQPPDNGFSTTNTADAISRASLTLTSSGISTSNKFIILLTDGQPDDIEAAQKEARRAREAGIRFGILLAPLFDGQISFRLTDMQSLVDFQQGDVVKVLQSRAELTSVISASFCPIAGAIFD